MTDPNGLLRTGLALHQSGNIAGARIVFGQVARLVPESPVPRRFLAIAMMDAGDVVGAAAILRSLVAFDPSEADFVNLLGHACGRMGNGGARWFQRAAMLSPGNWAFHYDAAGALLGEGDASAAWAAATRACTAAPELAECRALAAEAARRAGRTRFAIDALRAALALAPHDPEPAERLGALLLASGEGRAGRIWLIRAVRQGPPSAFGLAHLADALAATGDAAASQAVARAAATLDPAEIGAWIALAQGRAGASVTGVKWATRGTLIDPAVVEARLALAAALASGQRLHAAMHVLQQATMLAPWHAAVWNNLASLRLTARDLAGAAVAFARAAVCAPGRTSIASNALFGLNYDPAVDDAALAEAHRAWGLRAVAAASLPIRRRRSQAIGGDSRPLTVGFVSPDLKRHPVGYYLLPLLAARDRSRLRAVCFSDTVGADDMTAALRQAADGWRDVAGVTDAALADLIDADGIDVLVDLAGHTAGNRLSLFASRSAPLQLSWLGYFHSTGLPTIDALLTDADTVPAEATRYFVEPVVHLSAGRLCYAPPENAPPVGPPPCLRTGHITFGSFNNVAKLTPAVIATWCGILADVPGSRLVLKWHSLSDKRERQALTAAFAAQGLAADRLDLRGSDQHADMLAQYGDVDIALDPFPFTGCLTTSEALWMGVPVVTLAGARPVARQGVAFLRRLGRSDLVADGLSDYRRIAATLAATPEALAQMRSGQRAAVRTHLCDATAFARAFEHAVTELWHAKSVSNPRGE